VDNCAKLCLAIFLSTDPKASPGLYNVINPNPNRETDFMRVAKEEFGMKLRLVDFDEYLNGIKELGNKSSLLPMMEFYESKKVLHYLTKSPLHAAWLKSEPDYFKSKKLTDLLGSDYTDLEKPMDTMARDLLASKKDNKLYEKLGI